MKKSSQQIFQRLIILLSINLISFAGAEKPKENLSLKLEIKRAIKLGNTFLVTKRNEKGFWSDSEHPALTALVLTALAREPQEKRSLPESKRSESFQWLLNQQKKDGGIYVKGLATYNTSLSIMALLASKKLEYHPALLRARTFLVGQQTDWKKKGIDDSPYDGGIGYGGSYKHSDLSNTHLALEALYYTRHLAHDNRAEPQPNLNWKSALQFLSRCQNLTETNDQAWASDNKLDRGGFIYFPSSSKAGERPLKDGTSSLRSYGSMSYAGLLSLIYADLTPTDVRVQSVLEWLGEYFTVDENPRLGQQGLYYYYQAMAKALAASGREVIRTKADTVIPWRTRLGEKLVSLQHPDGAWRNQTSRWWENDSVLTTSYAVLALEQLYAVL